MMKKRMIFVFVIITCVGILTGCGQASFEKIIQKYLEEDDSEDYYVYNNIVENDWLDSNGTYMDVSEQKVTVEPREKQVCVSFAKNSFLDITYYYDASFTKEVEGDSCYLNPGESIYAKQPEEDNPYGENYRFSYFRVIEWKNEKREVWDEKYGDTSLVVHIPEDYKGTEISIEPIGEYQKKDIRLAAYYMDGTTRRQSEYGTWIINDKVWTDNKIEIKPGDECKVSYQYDGDLYYLEETAPESFSNVPKQDGEDNEWIVEFKNLTSFDDIEAFEVILHKCITASIEYASGVKAKEIEISVMNNENAFINDEKTSINRLQCGNEIFIKVDQEYQVLCDDGDVDNPEKLGDKLRYKVVVPDITEDSFIIEICKAKDVVIIPDKELENAEILIYNNSTNTVILDNQNFNQNLEVRVEIIPNEGYYISGKDVSEDKYSEIMKYKDYVEDIDKIVANHPVKKICTLILDESDEHGVCCYKLDGKEVEGTISVKQEQKLVLEYELKDETYQIVRDSSGIGGVVLDFANSLLHRNKITVTIPITEDLDGKSIKSTDYIRLERKE